MLGDDFLDVDKTASFVDFIPETESVTTFWVDYRGVLVLFILAAAVI